MCFDFLCKFGPEGRKIQRDIITNMHRSGCKLPDIFVRFLTKLEFSDFNKT